MNTSIFKSRKIFLIDAAGAMLSAASLLIPYHFDTIFGMPKSAVMSFIVIALFYLVYSFTIYRNNIANYKILNGIGIIKCGLRNGFRITKAVTSLSEEKVADEIFKIPLKAILIDDK